MFNFIKKYQTRRLLMFFAAASFVWLVNSLNEIYIQDLPFNLVYVNTNKDLRIEKEQASKVYLKIKASGFKLVGLAINPPVLELNLKGVAMNTNGSYFITENKQLFQFQSQLSNGIALLGFSEEVPIPLKVSRFSQKMVPVKFNGKLSPATNYFIKNISVFPDSVSLRGSKDFLKANKLVYTNSLVLNSLRQSLDTTLSIDLAGDFEDKHVLPEKVTIKVNLSEFSETVFKSSIEVIGLPVAYKVHFFPSVLEVIIAASVNDIRNISQNDFSLSVHYKDLKLLNGKPILPEIIIKNSTIYKAYLKQNTGVEYIITK